MNFSEKYTLALDKITKNCFKKQQAFVIYKKSNETNLYLTITDKYQTCNLEGIQENSFFFMPFNKANKGYCIDMKHIMMNDEILHFAEPLNAIQSAPFTSHTEHPQMNEDEFISYVESIKKAIKENRFSKLVASRIHSKKYKGNIVSAYLSLCDLYAHSFNYLIYIPNKECWIGATPETLLHIQNQELRTISLAGTQIKNEQNQYSWGVKERKEQEIVTEFIQHSLETLEVSNAQISEPYTIEAGNLAHLRTDLQYTFSKSVHPKEIIQLLHPTPAVCGMPKDICERFIQKNEPHNRAFYTGYLGIYQDAHHIESYVNLRCASIDNNYIHFYIGCGITIDSVAEHEWIETENKLQTLKAAFKM